MNTKKRSLLAFLLLALLCVSPVRSENGSDQLKTYEIRINEVFDFESKLRLADEYIIEARRQHNAEEEGNARRIKMLVYTENYNFDLFFEELPQHIEFWEKHEQWENMFDMWYDKVNMYIHSGKLETAIGEAGEMYDYAKKINYEYGIGLSYSVLGTTYHAMGRLEEAEQNLSEALQIFADQTNKMVLKTYFFLFGVLIDMDKYEEAVPLLKAWEENLIRMEEETKKTDPNAVDYGAWHLFYVESAYCYAGLEEFDKAEEYIRKASSLPVTDKDIYKGSLHMAKANLYYMQEKWDEAYLIVDTIYQERLRNGDITASVFMLENKADLAYKSGKYAESVGLYQELMHKKDSIRSLNVAAQLDELRTVYEVDKHVAEKERNRNYLIFAIIICVVLIVALFIWISYSRTITLKNRGLMGQIKEQDRLAEELEKERMEKLKYKNLLQTDNGAPETSKEDELFLELQNIMSKNKLYTENNITRKDIADKLGTNEKYLQEAVKKNLGVTFHEYITGLRLNYARELITRQGDTLTIEAVALDSGLGSRSTLHRLFRDHYGLTPEEFKKLVREKI